MTEPKFCINHPVAPAIDSCTRCSSPLCGMCANFDNAGVFCETCLEAFESEQLVKAQAQQAARPKPIPMQTEIEEAAYTPPTGKKLSAKSIQMGVIFLCTSAIAAQLYFYNKPTNPPQDPITLQKQIELTALVECLTVFSEIGVLLSRGETPGTDLRCEDSFVPNQVIENEAEIRIYHPNPRFYGFESIYVSNLETEPVTK